MIIQNKYGTQLFRASKNQAVVSCKMPGWYTFSMHVSAPCDLIFVVCFLSKITVESKWYLSVFNQPLSLAIMCIPWTSPQPTLPHPPRQTQSIKDTYVCLYSSLPSRLISSWNQRSLQYVIMQQAFTPTHFSDLSCLDRSSQHESNLPQAYKYSGY